MAKNEVSVTENQGFNLVTLSGELAEAINEEMDGLGSIPFDRVKIPSGGTVAFEVPGEDEENPDVVKELVGVILWHHPVNAYWKEKFAGGNEQPDCSSFDGKTGIDRETGECKDCASCPFNQFGSAQDGGSGKACKNVHRVYFLREDNPVPIILALPPTSLKGMRDYIGKRILLRNMRSHEAITKITLKKENSANNIAYSKAVFTFGGKLTPEQSAQAKAMADSIKSMDRNIDVDENDYAQPSNAPAAGPDGFMNVPEGTDEKLPFN